MSHDEIWKLDPFGSLKKKNLNQPRPFLGPVLRVEPFLGPVLRVEDNVSE